jgi:hypothetical protein
MEILIPTLHNCDIIKMEYKLRPVRSDAFLNRNAKGPFVLLIFTAYIGNRRRQLSVLIFISPHLTCLICKVCVQECGQKQNANGMLPQRKLLCLKNK